MDIDDDLFTQALGPGGLDIVHAQHVDHGGAHIARDAADARDGHDDDRQGHVPQRVQRHLKAAAGEARRPHAADGEDRDLHRKDEDGEQGDDKARQAVADDRSNLNDLVEHGVLAYGGRNAERHRDDEREQHGEHVQHDGIRHRRADDIDHLLLILRGIAEVAGEHVADPVDVLLDQRAVQAEAFTGSLIQLFILVGLHVGFCVAQHHGHGIAGHHFIDKEHQDGNDEKHEYNVDQSFQQISAFSHLYPPIQNLICFKRTGGTPAK